MAGRNFDKSSASSFISRISLPRLFLYFLALLQGSSQLLGRFYSAEDGSKPLLKVWLSLANEMSENWAAVSISLILLVLGYLLYSCLAHKSSFPGDNRELIWLLFINLALCLRVYSNNSISEKIAYLAPHLPAIIIISIVVVFVILGILVIQKEHKNTNELENLFQRTSVEQKSKTPTEDGTTNNVKPGMDTQSDPEAAFRLMHPFSYAYRSFAKDLDAKREIKREHKKRQLQIEDDAEQQKKNTEHDGSQKNSYRPENKRESVVGYVSAFMAFLICAGLIIILFTQSGSGEIPNMIQEIANYFLGITGILNAAKGPLTNFLLSSGVIFLIFILFLNFFLLVYTSLRVIAYLLSHPAEDTERIHRIGRAIKTFFLGTLDGVLRPLLFIPDFLECIGKMLLDTDMDEKIDEMYPPEDSSSKSSDKDD